MGYWRLAMGYWRLAMGYWRWGIGDGRLAMGYWRWGIGYGQRGEEGFGGGVVHLDVWTIELEIMLGYRTQFGITLHVMRLRHTFSQVKSVDTIARRQIY